MQKNGIPATSIHGITVPRNVTDDELRHLGSVKREMIESLLEDNLKVSEIARQFGYASTSTRKKLKDTAEKLFDIRQFERLKSQSPAEQNEESIELLMLDANSERILRENDVNTIGELVQHTRKSLNRMNEMGEKRISWTEQQLNKIGRGFARSGLENIASHTEKAAVVLGVPIPMGIAKSELDDFTGHLGGAPAVGRAIAKEIMVEGHDPVSVARNYSSYSTLKQLRRLIQDAAMHVLDRRKFEDFKAAPPNEQDSMSVEVLKFEVGLAIVNELMVHVDILTIGELTKASLEYLEDETSLSYEERHGVMRALTMGHRQFEN